MVALAQFCQWLWLSVIAQQLRLQNAVVVSQSFLRSNLHFNVVPKKSSAKDDIGILIRESFANFCGIIYCSERRDTIETAQLYLKHERCQCHLLP